MHSYLTPWLTLTVSSYSFAFSQLLIRHQPLLKACQRILFAESLIMTKWGRSASVVSPGPGSDVQCTQPALTQHLSSSGNTGQHSTLEQQYVKIMQQNSTFCLLLKCYWCIFSLLTPESLSMFPQLMPGAACTWKGWGEKGDTRTSRGGNTFPCKLGRGVKHYQSHRNCNRKGSKNISCIALNIVRNKKSSTLR